MVLLEQTQYFAPQFQHHIHHFLHIKQYTVSFSAGEKRGDENCVNKKEEKMMRWLDINISFSH
ncbi:CLUMA_CG008609, isoform A [Clunio marinus]|uniref:CLUMA_CG008609, isoform A n=1 Tax=Clunio marinus TaxID=568069 RepID=A0A1J1I4L2_9DIPT|nr:CLUMA_CG008609, isoform A [Clunio marinus]